MQLKNHHLPMLQRVLRFCNHLTTVNLSKNKLTVNNINIFIEDIQANKNIVKIDLSKNDLKSEVLTEFIKIFKCGNHSLQIIKLGDNKIKKSNQLKAEEIFKKYKCKVDFS